MTLCLDFFSRKLPQGPVGCAAFISVTTSNLHQNGFSVRATGYKLATFAHIVLLSSSNRSSSPYRAGDSGTLDSKSILDLSLQVTSLGSLGALDNWHDFADGYVSIGCCGL